MSVVNRLYDEVRRPEYTGENRCIPCTVTNLLIAAVGTAGLALVNPLVAGGFAVIAVASIALRGYLVPGTPTLTKRYFPDWLLGLFGKEPEPVMDAPAYEGDLEPEEYLLEHGIIREQEDGEDLELVDGFWPAWREEIDRVSENLEAEVADLLDLDNPKINPTGNIERVEDAEGCIVHDGDMRVAQWPSEEALAADLGAIEALDEYGIDVDSMDRGDAGQLLAGLRVFAEECPNCRGPMELGEDTKESCCRVADVFTYDCQDCGARVMEIETA
ncbi:MAG: hypothetical protein ABEI99_12230 [Halobaculum sp.]